MKYIFIIILISLISCNHEEEMNVHEMNEQVCTNLKTGFTFSDYDLIQPILDSICQKYPPVPTNTDEWGHEKNTEAILKELHEKCADLQIEMVCYACLESLPAQSIFRVKLDSNNVQIKRTFYLYVPEGKAMYYRN